MDDITEDWTDLEYSWRGMDGSISPIKPQGAAQVAVIDTIQEKATEIMNRPPEQTPYVDAFTGKQPPSQDGKPGEKR